MKVRNGFVSNSSSASFIVAVKQGTPCPTCKRTDVDFLDLVEQIGAHADYEDTELKARGIEDIWKRWKDDILEYCGDDERKEYEVLLQLMKDAESKGYKVGEVEISYRDPSTEKLLHELEERKSLVVLWCDHFKFDPNKVKL